MAFVLLLPLEVAVGERCIYGGLAHGLKFTQKWAAGPPVPGTAEEGERAEEAAGVKKGLLVWPGANRELSGGSELGIAAPPRAWIGERPRRRLLPAELGPSEGRGK